MKILYVIAGAVFVLSLAAEPSVAQKQKAAGQNCENMCKAKAGSDGRKYSKCFSMCSANRGR